MTSWTTTLASWAAGVQPADVPDDVRSATRLRMLDVIGLALAGLQTDFGKSVLSAARHLHPPGPAHVLGTNTLMSVPGAAFVNATFSQALEFDDTHNRSVVHMSSPVVASGLALAGATTVSGSDLLTAIAIGNEISARVGSVAPQQFHRRGFHPTGLFAPLGVTFTAGRLLGLGPDALVRAAGTVGSFSSGILQCWVDGTQTKFLHSGWAAQSGITAAALGLAGVTGPAEMLEGRWGLFASHLQDLSVRLDSGTILGDLGDTWESRAASFKPYPAAHVMHPYIDAVLRLRREGLRAEDVIVMECRLAPYQMGIVAEPADEKRRPRTTEHGRVSLQFTLAEALVTGRLDRQSYGDEARRDQRVLDLASRIVCVADPALPGPERYSGEVRVRTVDDREFVASEMYTRGSPENPMSEEDVVNKFCDNAGGILTPSAIDEVVALVDRLEDIEDAGEIAKVASMRSALDEARTVLPSTGPLRSAHGGG